MFQSVQHTPEPIQKNERKSGITTGKKTPASVSTPLIVQPKLTIGKQDDRYEEEADLVAENVMRMPEPWIQKSPNDEEEESEEVLSVPELRLRLPSVLGSNPAGYPNLQLELPMLNAMNLLDRQLDPTAIRLALFNFDPTLLTLPSQTAPGVVSEPEEESASESIPLVPAGAGPEQPREGSAGDVMKAIMAVPAVDTALTNLQTLALGRVRRDWRRLSTEGQIATITTTALVGGGALAGVLSNPDTREAAFELLNGRTFPVPGVDGLRFEVGISGTQWMVGFHLDVSSLLPESLGFGASSPRAFGPPSIPEGGSGTRIQPKAEEMHQTGRLSGNKVPFIQTQGKPEEDELNEQKTNQIIPLIQLESESNPSTQEPSEKDLPVVPEISSLEPSFVKEIYNTLSNLQDITGFAIDISGLIGNSRWIGQVSNMLGALGIFTSFLNSMLAIFEAMDTDRKIGAVCGVSYAIMSWALGRKPPSPWNYNKDMAKHFGTGWNNSVSNLSDMISNPSEHPELVALMIWIRQTKSPQVTLNVIYLILVDKYFQQYFLWFPIGSSMHKLLKNDVMLKWPGPELVSVKPTIRKKAEAWIEYFEKQHEKHETYKSCLLSKLPEYGIPDENELMATIKQCSEECGVPTPSISEEEAYDYLEEIKRS